mmetsp:Transcript_65837/g.166759  ORF Transcript_65837/g.166759 Transcript_65837/m.166759 type:complete len:142 (+) Transcript_65837:1378-1803(+)
MSSLPEDGLNTFVPAMLFQKSKDLATSAAASASGSSLLRYGSRKRFAAFVKSCFVMRGVAHLTRLATHLGFANTIEVASLVTPTLVQSAASCEEMARLFESWWSALSPHASSLTLIVRWPIRNREVCPLLVSIALTWICSA